MKTGIELIAIERLEQIENHGRTIKSDLDNNSIPSEYNGIFPLVAGAMYVLDEKFEWLPEHWDQNEMDYIRSKSYKEKLIIAGALIAAEIDRLQEIERIDDNKLIEKLNV
jgi:hypothetical protein